MRSRMTAFLSFLLILTVSKELLYFNEELLVIISFLSFLAAASLSVGNLVGNSLDASIREVADGVSSKIADYTKALALNHEVYSNQVSASLQCSQLAVVSLESLFVGSEGNPLSVIAVNRFANIAMARSFVESSQLGLQGRATPPLILEPYGISQSSILAGVSSPVCDSCLVVLPSDSFVLALVNSLLVSSLR